MRVVINEAHINRNRSLSHMLFFISLIGMGLGFVFTWTASPSSQTSQITCLVLPLLLLMTLASVRLANVWVREPRPEAVLDDALKGLGRKHTIFHHVLPAPHVLIGPEGVFTLTAIWQERAYRVKGKRWYGDEGLFRKINGYMRQDLLGNPFQEALFHAQQIQKLIDKIAPDSEVKVQPVIVFINPKASFESEDPIIPIVYADPKKKPALRQYLRDQTDARHITLDQEALDEIDRKYGLVTRQELAEMTGEEFVEDEEDAEPEFEVEADAQGLSQPRGTVYVLQAGQLFYIGSTTGPVEEAVNDLQAESAQPVEIIHMFEVKDPASTEATLRRRFDRKRQKERWYGLSKKDISWLKSLKGESS
jgi:hypothetical protein